MGDYYTQVALGNVPGRSIMSAMGERINVGTTAAGEDIWRGNDLSGTPALPASTTDIPVPSDAGEQMTMICENSNDTLAGTGAQKVRIFYIDDKGEEQTEDLDTAGLSEVDTVATNIRFINDYCAFQTGSVGVSVGNIRFYKKGANTLVYGMIAAGGNKSLVPHRMIPAGKILILKAWHAEEARGKRSNVRIRSTDTQGVLHSGAFCFKGSAFVNASTTGETSIHEKIPSFSIIKVSAWAVALGGDVGCGWWGELVEI